MADNVAVSAAASYTVASDDDGTAQHQYVKLEFGADGGFNRVTADTPCRRSMWRRSRCCVN